MGRGGGGHVRRLHTLTIVSIMRRRAIALDRPPRCAATAAAAMNDLLTIILLGIVEGVTEFIPVSSTGHLILAAELLGYDAAQWAVFNVVIQLGAILAVIVLYWRTFWAVLVGLLRNQAESWRFVRNIAGRLPALGGARPAAASTGSRRCSAAPPIVAWALMLGGVAILADRADRAAGHREGRRRHLARQGGRRRPDPVPVDDPRRQPLGRDHLGRPLARRRAAHRGRVQLLPRRPDHARRHRRCSSPSITTSSARPASAASRSASSSRSSSLWS